MYDTVRRVAAALPAETTFLGFAGSPWTVATYMLAGKDRDAARTRAYAEPELVDALLSILAGLVWAWWQLPFWAWP